MAYANEYKAYWASKNVTGILYIMRDKEPAALTPVLTLIDESLIISYDSNGWEGHIIKMKCEFEIANQKDNWFDLLPLMTAAEKYWKIKVVSSTPTAITLFEGFLNCETVSQGYLKYQSIKFVASSYLSKLDNVHPTSVDTLQNLSFISLIDEILVSAGASFNIRVNCEIYPITAESAPLDNTTLFNTTGCSTELWWEDNVKRKSSLQILESILTAFDCYLYWWNGYWYIEQYRDIKETAIFIEYETGASFDIDNSGTPVTLETLATDIHTWVWINTSLTLSTVPGNSLISIELDDKPFLNLLKKDLTAITDVVSFINPGLRLWEKWPGGELVTEGFEGELYGFMEPGLPYKNITNSIKRTWWYSDPGTGDVLYYRGLYTKFRMTISDESDSETELTISFKFATLKSSFGFWTGDWDDYTFEFNWYMKVGTSNVFVVYNSGTDTWELDGSPVGLSYLQSVTVSGSQFDDDKVSCDVSITIPVGTIAGLAGDEYLMLAIGTEQVTRIDVAYTNPCDTCWYGDFKATVNDALEDNLLEGNANTSFIEKREISLDLFSVASFNYRNVIFTGIGLEDRTGTWKLPGIGELLKSYSIQQLVLKDLYQKYNATHQTLSGSIKKATFTKPLRLMYDSEQSDKPFLLMGYSYNVCRDIYDNVVLLEYDNTTAIDLV